MKTEKNHSHSQTADAIEKIEDEAQALLAATADATESAVSEARNRFKAALDTARETCGVVRDHTVRGAKATDKIIRENPYQALGIAFGIGALLGFLMTRRER